MIAYRRGKAVYAHPTGRDNPSWWFGAGSLPAWWSHWSALLAHYRYRGQHRAKSAWRVLSGSAVLCGSMTQVIAWAARLSSSYSASSRCFSASSWMLRRSWPTGRSQHLPENFSKLLRLV